MEFSKNGIKWLEQLEGRKRFKYLDAAGLCTLGIGHLLTKSELTSGKMYIGGEAILYSQGLTHEQIDQLLIQDLQSPVDCVNSCVKVELTQNQFDCLVSFAYNCGNGAFQNSTLLKLLNKGGYDQVPTQLLRWVHADGKVCQGLINRREREIELWNDKQIYQTI
jgi:lysozyme